MPHATLKNLTVSQIIGIIGIILLITFIVQNMENVYVRLIIWNVQIPLFLLIIIAFIIGFYASIISGAGLSRFFRKKNETTFLSDENTKENS